MWDAAGGGLKSAVNGKSSPNACMKDPARSAHGFRSIIQAVPEVGTTFLSHLNSLVVKRSIKHPKIQMNGGSFLMKLEECRS